MCKGSLQRSQLFHHACVTLRSFCCCCCCCCCCCSVCVFLHISDLVACRNVVGPHLFSPSLTTLYRNRYTLTHKTSHHTALSLVPTTTIWASPFSQFFKSTRAWDCGKTKLMCVTARGMQQQQFDCRLFSDREARGTSKVLQRHELSSQNLLLHGKDTVQYLVPFGFFSTKDTINRQSNFSLLGWKDDQ